MKIKYTIPRIPKRYMPYDVFCLFLAYLFKAETLLATRSIL